MRQTLSSWITLALGLLLYGASASQIAFNNGPQESYSFGTGSSMDLSAVSQEFTVLSNPRFPSHQVRIKRSNFCDPTVKVWTGMLTLESNSIF